MYHIGCVIFAVRHKRNPKNIRKESDLLVWNDVTVWKDFRPPYTSETVLAKYIPHVMSTRFMWRSLSDAGNQSRRVHSSVTTHTGDSISFILHAKQMTRFFLITSIFLLSFINLFNWKHFYLTGYGFWTWAKPNGVFCWKTCMESWLSLEVLKKTDQPIKPKKLRKN